MFGYIVIGKHSNHFESVVSLTIGILKRKGGISNQIALTTMVRIV